MVGFSAEEWEMGQDRRTSRYRGSEVRRRQVTMEKDLDIGTTTARMAEEYGGGHTGGWRRGFERGREKM
jgi:hypothetical protein